LGKVQRRNSLLHLSGPLKRDNLISRQIWLNTLQVRVLFLNRFTGPGSYQRTGGPGDFANTKFDRSADEPGSYVIKDNGHIN